MPVSDYEALGQGVHDLPSAATWAVIAGGAAGNLTVTGVAVGDKLYAVIQLPRTIPYFVTGAASPLAVTGVQAADDATQMLQFNSDGVPARITARAGLSVPAVNQVAYTGAAMDANDDVMIQTERRAVNLTGEFTITAQNTINNAAGTATTGERLLVCYLNRT